MKIKPIKKPSSAAAPAGSAERVNRTVYLTVAVLLIVLAVAVAMTGAANKARRGAAELTGKTAGTVQPNATTKLPKETQKTPPAATRAPETVPPEPAKTEPPKPAGTEAAAGPEIEAGKTVPSLSLPASGQLGKRHDPTVQVFSDTLNEWRVHLGIDIVTPTGAPVYAAAEGKVLEVTEDPMMGTTVSVAHAGSAVTVYKNLAPELAEGIRAGASVKSGQLLGAVGDGGVMELADDSHLHFEMCIGGDSVDPLEYFSPAALTSLQSPDDINYEG